MPWHPLYADLSGRDVFSKVKNRIPEVLLTQVIRFGAIFDEVGERVDY